MLLPIALGCLSGGPSRLRLLNFGIVRRLVHRDVIVARKCHLGQKAKRDPRDEERKKFPHPSPPFPVDVHWLKLPSLFAGYGKSPFPYGRATFMRQEPERARGYLGGRYSQGRATDGDRFATGDLGWVNEEGYLFLAGRKRSPIRVAGVTVDPADVEAVIAQIPSVRGVAVIGQPTPPEGERVNAVVEGEGVAAIDVVRHCRRYLKDFQVPEIVEVRASLPRSAAGKILRRALRSLPDFPPNDGSAGGLP